MGSAALQLPLSATVVRKGVKRYLAHCIELDIYSQGETAKKARENIIEACELFIEDCAEHGTLEEVLKECGFQIVRKTSKKEEQTPLAALPDGGRYIKFPAAIPMAR